MKTPINTETSIAAFGLMDSSAARATGSQTYQPIDSESASPTLMQQCLQQPCMQNLLFGVRSLGAGMASAGLTSILCEQMMDNPQVSTNQGVFLGVGVATWLATLLPAKDLVGEGAKQFVIQGCKDAVVPALSVFSLYFLQMHGVI